ncbi:alpha/beta fold hydrolase [Hymenobacter negativus]|uniref:Alpha/beta hydrolase n=1 Tax=Hymenobacter negativus TaxID=2795026 RepID=A0ABS3QK06_9BACT|nr:alpha/beta hydrolase [Hymenobacter negativus]MBO2011579.1 alpha/beta hydrolase [Hymenobacter negativus]
MSTTETYTHETAPTQYIPVNGVQFAYRTFGKADGLPLIFLQHFTGTMDNWDPLVTNGLAETHRIVLFDNVGVGNTSGETPTTVAQMTRDAYDFIQALGFERVDVLGFSLGNFIAQQLILDHPTLVRRVILAGGAPVGQGADEFKFVTSNLGGKSPKDILLYLFFAATPSSQQQGEAFIQRLQSRVVDHDIPSTVQVFQAQYRAIVDWCNIPDPEFTRLAQITQPALVVQGSNDTMFPTSQSVLLFQHLPNAQLSLYPDSSHGSLFQHARLFAEQVRYFLQAED